MPNLSYDILKRRQKTYIKAYALLCLILILSMGFFTYKKWEEYSYARAIISSNQNYISALTDKSTEEKTAYEDQKPGFDAFQEETNEKLENIFPIGDSYTNLTREFDSFEEKLSTKNSSFEVSHISYMNPVFSENYAILPLRMTISSSRDNFTKFLHLIETSGSLDNETRLMDISSIRLNFQDKGDDKEEALINFNVQINAYFRK